MTPVSHAAPSIPEHYEELWLSAPQLAELLGVSRCTVWRLVKAGLPYVGPEGSRLRRFNGKLALEWYSCKLRRLT